LAETSSEVRPIDGMSDTRHKAPAAPEDTAKLDAPLDSLATSQKPKRGDLRRAVEDAALRQSDWFTGYELTDRMKAEGFQFSAQNPNISVNDILRKLVAMGTLELEPGMGSNPNKYRVKG